MPELPEVETVVRGLNETVVGKTIRSVRINAPAASIVVGKSLNKKSFESNLSGKTIKGVVRRGKNILINLSDDITLWAHLKMTGRFLYVPNKNKIDKHDLALFDLSSQKKSDTNHLRFNDIRRFGRLRLYRTGEVLLQKGLSELGPEPLDMTESEFFQLFNSTCRMVKPALLDQSFIAGIGNIYADESLFAAKIHPRKLTNRISNKKISILYFEIRKILNKAIKHMGSSVDNYKGVNGKPGTFQNYLKAYNNENNPCKYCGRKIVREVIGSRSTHFCRNCQRL